MAPYDGVLDLCPVVTALALIGAHVFLTGPIATAIHSVGRAPLDIELVSDLAPSGAELLDQLLTPAIVRIGPETLLRVDESLPITLRRAQSGPFSPAAFARAVAIVLDEASGFATWVASAEDAGAGPVAGGRAEPALPLAAQVRPDGCGEAPDRCVGRGLYRACWRRRLASLRRGGSCWGSGIRCGWSGTARWKPSGAGRHTVAP